MPSAVVSGSALWRAPLAKPQLVVCDGPVSALDVSIQAERNLLQDLQVDFGLTYLFVSTTSVVEHISDRI